MIYPTEKYEMRIPTYEVKMESAKAKANAGMQWLQELLERFGVFAALKK